MSTATINLDWQRTIRLLPGYDPFAQAGDCWFDEGAASYVVEFVETCCTHVKGALAGKPLLLEPWQKALYGNLYGWKRPDKTRRYREALVFVPRGNSKTTMGAAMVCVGLYLGDEPGAELYSSAAEREQARLCFEVVSGMIRNETQMSNRAELYKYSIVVGDKIYKALSAQAGSKHGFSPQLIVNDELHAHPTPELTEVLMTGTLKRRQPLTVHLTTSDYEREGSICNDKHDYACKVRDGLIEDPAFLPVIYEASREDDYTDPKVWAKANPNLGVSVPLEYMERECKRAKDDPLFENTFKRLHLNIRTEQAERLLPVERWDACEGELPDLRGMKCWAGLDLGATRDFTAFVPVFPLDDGRFAIKPIFWIPEATAMRRKEKLGPVYQVWERAGALRLTPGNEIDYTLIEKEIAAFCIEHDMQEIAADRLFQGAQIMQNLYEKHGITIFEHGQGFLSMASPTRAFLEHVGNGKIVHDGNPVMRWMISNLTGKQDEAGNWKPDKKRSAEKIDGPVGAIMGLTRAIIGGEAESVYEERGVLCI